MPPAQADTTWVTARVAPNNTSADFIDVKAFAASSAATHPYLGGIDASQ